VNSNAVPAPGPAEETSKRGAGNEKSTAGGAGAGFTVTDGSASSGGGQQSGTRVWPQPGNGSGDGGLPETTHYALPKDGQFGATIVGGSLQETYPEVRLVWHDRMAYTVYLHVGLEKSWILQYSLPRDAEAQSGGNIARLEAPWPYNIVRPNLAPGSINADALMIHGFVNAAGRFESLAVAFPPEFPQAEFVLGALAQWQFRPAAQSGQTQRVEVVLIIPEEFE
jgi:hypothetical protein